MTHSHKCPHEGGHEWFDPNGACLFKGKEMTCWSYYPDTATHTPSIAFLRSHPFVISKHAGTLNSESDYSAELNPVTP